MSAGQLSTPAHQPPEETCWSGVASQGLALIGGAVRDGTRRMMRGQERGRRSLQGLMENHDLRERPALAGQTLRRQVSPAEQVQVARDGAAPRQHRLLRVSTACALEGDLGPAPRST